MAELRPFSSDGHSAHWALADDDHYERLTLRWDNEAWTASVTNDVHRSECVLRLSPTWHTRQLIVFRDLPEPDLWLGTDGTGNWGEINGAHRPELAGASDVVVGDSPFAHTVAIRRLDPTPIGETRNVEQLALDVETLALVRRAARYTRVGRRRWRCERRTHDIELDVEPDIATVFDVVFDVDEYGLVGDVAGYRRLG